MSLEHAPQGQKQQRLILRREARRRAGGISRATEHRLLKNPASGWPRPVPITGGLSGYIESEVDEFIARLIAARDQEGAPG